MDLFGRPCKVDQICEIAHSENIKVLVDGAQSFGASFNNRVVGSMGDATTTSFFPAKPLGCYGDGGAVFTNDEDLVLEYFEIADAKSLKKSDNWSDFPEHVACIAVFAGTTRLIDNILLEIN